MRTVIGPAKIDQRETIQTTDVFKTVSISFLMFFNELIILTIFFLRKGTLLKWQTKSVSSPTSQPTLLGRNKIIIR